jgi:hypothetical protein
MLETKQNSFFCSPLSVVCIVFWCCNGFIGFPFPFLFLDQQSLEGTAVLYIMEQNCTFLVLLARYLLKVVFLSTIPLLNNVSVTFEHRRHMSPYFCLALI